MDYFIPSKIYAKPVLRYACPALVFNIIIFLWNIVLSKGYSFLSQASYWYTMALLTIAYIFFSYLMHRKYIMEKKRIQHLLERKNSGNELIIEIDTIEKKANESYGLH